MHALKTDVRVRGMGLAVLEATGRAHGAGFEAKRKVSRPDVSSANLSADKNREENMLGGCRASSAAAAQPPGWYR